MMQYQSCALLSLSFSRDDERLKQEQEQQVLSLVDQFVENNIPIWGTDTVVKLILSAGKPARHVREITQIPAKDKDDEDESVEFLDGIVKTIHPLIAAGIGGNRDELHLKHLRELAEIYKVEEAPIFDYVGVTLYDPPVVEDGEEFFDQYKRIDIGGHQLLRMALKFDTYVTTMCKFEFLEEVAQGLKDEKEASLGMRKLLGYQAALHLVENAQAVAEYKAAEMRAFLRPQ